MFSHVTVGTNDLAKAGAFYDAVFEALGMSRGLEGEAFISYGERSGGRFFVMSPFNGEPATVGNGVHAAFRAADRVSVDDFHAAALANGGSDEGAPGLRLHYHADYYGAYVRDPDGNKLQAVSHEAE